MWVVKLGGSLGRDPSLREWLRELSELGGGRVVVVPGGGGFADQVREHRAQWAFDDVAAHNMVVLAMAQYGLMMQGLCPGMSLAVHEKDIQGVLRNAGVALWAPFALLREQPDELTQPGASSDCMAAWLSNRLNAEMLVLVKSASIEAGMTMEQYAEQGVIDRRFGSFTRGAPYPIEVLHKGGVGRMRELLLHSVG